MSSSPQEVEGEVGWTSLHWLCRDQFSYLDLPAIAKLLRNVLSKSRTLQLPLSPVEGNNGLKDEEDVLLGEKKEYDGAKVGTIYPYQFIITASVILYSSKSSFYTPHPHHLSPTPLIPPHLPPTPSILHTTHPSHTSLPYCPSLHTYHPLSHHPPLPSPFTPSLLIPKPSIIAFVPLPTPSAPAPSSMNLLRWGAFYLYVAVSVPLLVVVMVMITMSIPSG